MAFGTHLQEIKKFRLQISAGCCSGSGCSGCCSADSYSDCSDSADSCSGSSGSGYSGCYSDCSDFGYSYCVMLSSHGFTSGSGKGTAVFGGYAAHAILPHKGYSSSMPRNGRFMQYGISLFDKIYFIGSVLE